MSNRAVPFSSKQAVVLLSKSLSSGPEAPATTVSPSSSIAEWHLESCPDRSAGSDVTTWAPSRHILHRSPRLRSRCSCRPTGSQRGQHQGGTGVVPHWIHYSSLPSQVSTWREAVLTHPLCSYLQCFVHAYRREHLQARSPVDSWQPGATLMPATCKPAKPSYRGDSSFTGCLISIPGAFAAPRHDHNFAVVRSRFSSLPGFNTSRSFQNYRGSCARRFAGALGGR